jgi:hypothetical protein
MQRRFGSSQLWLVGLLALGSAFLANLANANSVTLAWDPSPGGNITSYTIYFGPASGVYTNSIDVGTATSATISNLVAGATYFFAATATDSSGLESEFSNEVSYTVPSVSGPVPVTIQITPARLALLATKARPGSSYQVLSSPDLLSWRILATITAAPDGSLQFLDPAGPTNPAAFYRLRPVH